MYKIVYIHKTSLCYDLILHKIYEKYLSNSKIKLRNSFKLPSKTDFEKNGKDWYETNFYELSEDSFFKTIQYLLKPEEKSLNSSEKEDLRNLYNSIRNRTPIKNCYKYDLLVAYSKEEKKKGDFCEKENQLFENLQKIPEIANHWSFLRYDPKKPIYVVPQINPNIEDEESIRILREKNGKKSIEFLQKIPNSFIKNLATHYRILISYYHNDKKAQEEIQKQASEIFGS